MLAVRKRSGSSHDFGATTAKVASGALLAVVPPGNGIHSPVSEVLYGFGRDSRNVRSPLGCRFKQAGAE
eukprot:4793096-Heterocapsa_arctica.AAC.1